MSQLNIKFVSTERQDENTVKATYSLDNVNFSVFWSNLCPQSGDVDYSYGLMAGFDAVESESHALYERVVNAIDLGEDDKNKDSELYLYIRDTFDSNDCENI